MKKVVFIVFLTASSIFPNAIRAEVITPLASGFLATLGSIGGSALLSYFMSDKEDGAVVIGGIVGAFVGYQWIAPTITEEFRLSSQQELTDQGSKTTTQAPGKIETIYRGKNTDNSDYKKQYHRWSTFGSVGGIIFGLVCISAILHKS